MSFRENSIVASRANEGLILSAPLHWHLSVDKNSLSIRPTDETLSDHVQTVDGQRLAGQHVSRL